MEEIRKRDPGEPKLQIEPKRLTDKEVKQISQSFPTREQRRRYKLWNKNPKCRRCGTVTIWPEKDDNRDNICTFQHIHPKGHPMRGKGNNKNTMYCRKCNIEDAEIQNNELRTENRRVIGEEMLNYDINKLINNGMDI